jgi:CubicO group peptidase (beta-lactamase class C family)
LDGEAPSRQGTGVLAVPTGTMQPVDATRARDRCTILHPEPRMPRRALAVLAGLAFTRAAVSLAAQPPATAGVYAPSACPVVALPARADAVDSLVVARMRAERIPGVSLAVVRDGRVDARAYGYADLEHCAPADTSTVFGVGSLSKMLTAYATLRLVDAGKLSIDDTITKYLPTALAWRSITVRELLSHTSGIRDYTQDDRFHAPVQVDRRAEFTSDSLIRVFDAAPLNFVPGTEWAYSNTGYIVLSVVLEQVTGRPFPDLMREWVYDPLGMRSARPWDPSVVVPGLAWGYWVRDGALVRGRYVGTAFGRYGDTGILATAGDLARFAAELLAPQHVSPALLRRMTAPAVDPGWIVPYGFGIVADEARGVPTLAHGGSFAPGYTSYLIALPTRRTAVVAITNHWDADAPSLVWTVAHLVDSTIATPRTTPRTTLRTTPSDRDPDVDRTHRVLALLRGDSTALPLTAEYRRTGYPVFQRLIRKLPPLDSLAALGCDPLPASVASLLPAGAVTECDYGIYLGGGSGPSLGVFYTRTGAVAGVRGR